MSFHLDDRGFKNRTVLQNRTEKVRRLGGRRVVSVRADGRASAHQA
jgi:hypothetical protein